MAARTFDQITEDLSRQESVLTMQDCCSKANATALGTFLAGFSAGIAVQAQLYRSLPRRMKAFLVIPIVFGLSVSLPVHRYMVHDCITQWKTREEAASKECECSCTEDSNNVSIPVSN